MLALQNPIHLSIRPWSAFCPLSPAVIDKVASIVDRTLLCWTTLTTQMSFLFLNLWMNEHHTKDTVRLFSGFCCFNNPSFLSHCSIWLSFYRNRFNFFLNTFILVCLIYQRTYKRHTARLLHGFCCCIRSPIVVPRVHFLGSFYPRMAFLIGLTQRIISCHIFSNFLIKRPLSWLPLNNQQCKPSIHWFVCCVCLLFSINQGRVF